MSGAGATSRMKATAGVATVWGRALHTELVKVVTLPAMWWSAAAAGAAAAATMMSV
ncbi:cupin, partial [Actinomyces oris]